MLQNGGGALIVGRIVAVVPLNVVGLHGFGSSLKKMEGCGMGSNRGKGAPHINVLML